MTYQEKIEWLRQYRAAVNRERLLEGSGGRAASARGAPDSHSKHYRQCWLFSVANHASPFGESTAYVGSL